MEPYKGSSAKLSLKNPYNPVHKLSMTLPG